MAAIDVFLKHGAKMEIEDLHFCPVLRDKRGSICGADVEIKLISTLAPQMEPLKRGSTPIPWAAEPGRVDTMRLN